VLDLPHPLLADAEIPAQLLKRARVIAKPALLDHRLLAIGEARPAHRQARRLHRLRPGHPRARPPEYMAVEDLVASAKVMALATLRLLGVLPS
jgi:hypothetical protein